MRPLMSLPRASVSFDFERQELLRFDHFAQPDGLALVVRNLDADRRLARHALDEDALGAQGEAEIVGEAGDAAVLDAGFGLELEGRDHGAGIDLHHRAAHVELAALFAQHLRQVLQLIFIDGAVLVGAVQQRGRRQFEAAGQPRHGGLAVLRGVGARGDGDGVVGLRLGNPRSRRRSDCCSSTSESKMRSMPLRPFDPCGSGDGAEGIPACAIACGAQASSAGAGARFGTSCAVTTGFACRGARFFSNSFAAFLRRAFHAPVGEAVERGVHKSESRLRPQPHRAERERRRKIQRRPR